MMHLQSGRHCTFAISLLFCCVLFSKPTKLIAAPADEPGISSTTVAPATRSRGQQVKLADAPCLQTSSPLSREALAVLRSNPYCRRNCSDEMENR